MEFELDEDQRLLQQSVRETLDKTRALPEANSATGQPEWEANGEHYGFQHGFARIFLQAQQDGGLPQTITAASLAAMFEAML